MTHLRNREVRVLLMAAGLGTRLRPLTDSVPKCLVPIHGRPLLDYWFDRFAEAGLRHVLINTHHLPGRIREYIRRLNATGRFEVRETFEPTLLGSAGTVRANRDWVPPGGEALIVYADNLSGVHFGDMLAFHRAQGAEMTMLLFRSLAPKRCGIAQLDDSGRIVGFEEKPRQPRGNLANAGIYAMSAAAYHEIADAGAFDLGFDVLPRFVGRMHGFSFDGYHRDIGTLESLAAAEADMAAGRVVAPARLKINVGSRPAVFLDRDGTVIRQVHYIAEPGDVALLPGAAEALRMLGEAGFARVLVTNQSAIGRGLVTEQQAKAVQVEVERQLGEQAAAIEGYYHCPVAPSPLSTNGHGGADRATIDHPDRKPGPGMLLRAARELNLDLSRSWMVGDMVSDLLAGRNAGCCGSLLVRTGHGTDADEATLATADEVAHDLLDAVRRILRNGRTNRFDAGTAPMRLPESEPCQMSEEECA